MSSDDLRSCALPSFVPDIKPLRSSFLMYQFNPHLLWHWYRAKNNVGIEQSRTCRLPALGQSELAVCIRVKQGRAMMPSGPGMTLWWYTLAYFIQLKLLSHGIGGNTAKSRESIPATLRARDTRTSGWHGIAVFRTSIGSVAIVPSRTARTTCTHFFTLVFSNSNKLASSSMPRNHWSRPWPKKIRKIYVKTV